MRSVRALRALFALLLGWQTMTAVLNMAAHDWTGASLSVACSAFVVLASVISERNALNVANLHAGRLEKVAYWRAFIIQARQDSNEDAEKYGLGMLAIWGGDPP